MIGYFKDKSVLISVVCGIVGAELARQPPSNAEYGYRELTDVNNNEQALFKLDQTYLAEMNKIMDHRDRIDEHKISAAGAYHYYPLNHSDD